MKITWVTSKLNFETAGGSVEEIDFVLRTLVERGHDVTVVTTYSDGNKITQKLPYKIIEKQFKSQRLLAMQRSVYALLRRNESGADAFIVDAHLFMYGAGMYRLRGGKVPVASFVNQYLSCWKQYESSLFPRARISILHLIKESGRRLIERTLGMFLANRVDLYAFVSPTLRGMYENFGMRHSDRDMVIGDPIDIAQLMEKGKVTEQSYREHLKKSPPITLFFSSRMSPGKGFDMLLKGFSLVRNKEDFRVILGGTGPEELFVHALVKDLNLEPYVTFPGWVTKEQLFEYYRTVDVFVQADWWPAGTSISLIYALAFGVPSILPGGGGLAWNAGESALYFPYRDPEKLARCIERMGENHALRSHLSGKCYERLKMPDMNYRQLIGVFASRLEESVTHCS